MAAGAKRPVRVMLVEDNAAVRQAVADLLNATADLRVCGEAATVAEAGPVAETTLPDVAIVDLRLPDGSGVEAGRQVRSCHPGARVVLLTSASEEEALVAAVLAGACAYLVKQVLGSDLTGTVRSVADGAMLLDPAAGAVALEELSRRAASDDRRLLALLALNRTNRQIAEGLGLDEATVRERVTSIISRVGAGRRWPSTCHRSPSSALTG